MRAIAVTPMKAPAVKLVARRVVATVAGTRIGGVTTTNATIESPRVRPANANKTTDATEAITT